MDQIKDDEVLHDVRDLVRRRRVRYVLHAEERMEQRGYDKSQVTECLSKGRFVERPYLTNRSGPVEYKFRLEANIDGEPMQVVAVLRPSENVLVITVIDPC